MDPHQPAPVSLLAMLRNLSKHWDLVRQMTRRDVVGRYRGSILGLAWSFVTPFLMLLIYTFVFAVIFRARWGMQQHGNSTASFAIVMFVGIMIHGVFADAVTRAPTLILSNANYVRRVVFPLELLPVIMLGSVLFHMLVSLGVWLIVAQFVLSSIPWTGLLLPVIIAPLLIGTLGFCWMLSSVGVFVRDVGQTVGLLASAMLFLAPVFYPLDSIPDPLKLLILANPLTFVIEQSREVLIWGNLPSWKGLAIYWACALLVAQLGLWWFQRTRKGFADVL
jgi:lipopolysaccharide transport system permease protein